MRIAMIVCILSLLPVLQIDVSAAENIERGTIERLSTFSESLAAVSVKGRWGFINEEGTLVVAPMFHGVGSFQKGYAPVKLVNKWGVIDRKGRYVVNPFYDDMGLFAEDLIAVKANGKWGYITIKDKMVIPPQFGEALPFSQGLAAVRIDNSWGFIDSNGKYAINPRFSGAGSFSDGLAPVQIGSQWGFIDKDGDLTINPQFQKALRFSQGLAAAQDDTLWGFIDKNGRFQINPGYDNSRIFAEGLAAVQKDGKWGYINLDGKLVIPLQYQEAGEFSRNIARVVFNDKAIYITPKGKDAGVGITAGMVTAAEPPMVPKLLPVAQPATAKPVLATLPLQSSGPFVVTPLSGGVWTGYRIIPNTPQTVSANGTARFTIIPAKNSGLPFPLSGTCGIGTYTGSLEDSVNGITYTTAPVTASCTVGVPSPSMPPTATAVQLQTYGALPVVTLNLTQSLMNINVNTNQSAIYTQGGFPLAAGLPGVYYPRQDGFTSTFNNVTNPGVNVDGVTTASLMPLAAPAVAPATGFTYKNDFSFMSLFTMFPSWSNINNYDYTQYVSMTNLKNQGAAADSYKVLAGYLDSNAKDMNDSRGGIYSYAHSMGNSSNACINLNVLPNGAGDPQTGYLYTLNIKSLGGSGNNGYQPGSKGVSAWQLLGYTLDAMVDVTALAEGDPLGIAAMLYGAVDSIHNMVGQLSINNKTNNVYTAKYQGINVSAAPAISNTYAQLVLTQGDNNALMYTVQPADPAQTLPLSQQNAVIITTWRQMPQNTGSASDFSSADLLIVAVLNQAVFASQQLQQYVNGSAPQTVTAALKYRPTKEQAQDSTSLLSILTAIEKANPAHAGHIIKMFGIHGNYEKIQLDPKALATLDMELVAILEAHKKDIPLIRPYLTKLVQK